MFTIFYKKIYSKNLVVKVVFGDRVDVLNDFLYNMEYLYILCIIIAQIYLHIHSAIKT